MNFAKETFHIGIALTKIGHYSDLVAYYRGSDGNVWAFHTSGNTWSNEGPAAPFIATFPGRRRGLLTIEPCPRCGASSAQPWRRWPQCPVCNPHTSA